MKSHLTTKDLEVLRKKLPHGGIKKISELTALDQSTVSKVLQGKFKNVLVIQAAIDLIKREKKKVIDLKKRINTI